MLNMYPMSKKSLDTSKTKKKSMQESFANTCFLRNFIAFLKTIVYFGVLCWQLINLKLHNHELQHGLYQTDATKTYTAPKQLIMYNSVLLIVLIVYFIYLNTH